MLFWEGARLLRKRLDVFLLLVLVGMGQAWLVPWGLAIQESDQLMFQVWGIHAVQNSQFTLFPFDMNYGCTFLPSLQTLWAMLWSGLGILKPETARFAFDYVVVPLFMALGVLWSLRRLGYAREAFWIACVCALGLQFWVGLAGIGFYLLALASGFFWLTWDAKKLWSLKPAALLGMGVLAGLTLVNFRAGAIYVLCAVTPWSWVLKNRPRLSRGKWDRIWIWTLSTLVLLFAVSEALGPNWGGALPFRLHALPNVVLALQVLFAGYVIRGVSQLRKQNRFQPRGWAIFTLGAFLGFLPELTHYLIQGRTVGFASVSGQLQPVSKLWSAFLQLHFGDLRFFAPSKLDGLKWVGVSLSLFGLQALIQSARKSETALRVVMSGVLSVAAFLVFHGTNPGAPRYLLFLFPCLLAAWAQVLKQWPSLGKVLITVMVVSTMNQRMAWFKSKNPEVLKTEIMEVVQSAREKDVSYLWSDDYEQTFRYFVASGGALLSTQIGPWPDMPPGVHKGVGESERAFLIYTGNIDPRWMGTGEWQLLKKIQVGDWYERIPKEPATR